MKLLHPRADNVREAYRAMKITRLLQRIDLTVSRAVRPNIVTEIFSPALDLRYSEAAVKCK